MSINFPTAFWKNSHKVDDSTPPSSSPSITWNKQLFYSPLSTEYNDLGPAKVVYTSNYRYDYSQDHFPMQPNPETNSNPFVDLYNSAQVAITDEDETSRAYFSWYLDGGDESIGGDPQEAGAGAETRKQFAHRSNPWIIEENGRKINLFAEADGETLKFINMPLYQSSVELGGTRGTVEYSYAYYNNFVQSGSATGSFTLSSSSPKNLQILVSGLAEITQGPTLGGFTDFYDYCSVRIKRTDGGDGGDLDETVCNGRNHPEDTTRNWDMNHMVFFIGDGNQQKPTYYNRETSSDTISYHYLNGEQGTYDNVVDQTKRRDYVRAVSQFTGEYTLAAGDYQVVINFTSNDGQYNSGAFIGATFNFS